MAMAMALPPLRRMLWSPDMPSQTKKPMRPLQVRSRWTLPPMLQPWAPMRLLQGGLQHYRPRAPMRPLQGRLKHHRLSQPLTSTMASALDVWWPLCFLRPPPTPQHAAGVFHHCSKVSSGPVWLEQAALPPLIACTRMLQSSFSKWVCLLTSPCPWSMASNAGWLPSLWKTQLRTT